MLDAAARYYVRMYGESAAQPTGALNGLLDAARATDGGLDEQEIAKTLNMPELGVDIEVTPQRSTTPAAENDD